MEGKAALQISNILCFYEGICQDIIWLDDDANKTQAKEVPNLLSKERVNPITYQVYPNPTKNSFIVKGTDAAKIEQVEVYNLMGQKVKVLVSVISKTEVQVNLNQQQKGIFIVRIIDQNGTLETVRLIKN